MTSVTASSFTISFFLFFISQIIAQPAIKTITTKYGDIFDCVDMYKQPSLNHPLLQNHTIQTKPSFAPEALSPRTNEVQYSIFGLENGGCPDGSVPIRRIRKEDAKRVRAYLNEHPSSLVPDSPSRKPGWHFAGKVTRGLGVPIKAARGMLNVYNPRVSKEQHSDSLVYVKNGQFESHNAIHAGWTVFPSVYGDSRTRLHTVWTADNYRRTGCVDMICPGFVQISKTVTLGSVISPVSQYGGAQYQLPITISQDQYSGNWWLITSTNAMVGYWPNALFTDLKNHAEEAGWGGRVYSPYGSSLASPPMGSGHKPGEGFKKSCFVEEMQYVKAGQGTFEDLNGDLLVSHADNPSCYDVNLFMDSHDRANIYFGGPGGQCGRV